MSVGGYSEFEHNNAYFYYKQINGVSQKVRDLRVSGHVLAQEVELVGEVPARDHTALAGARAVRLVAQVPRVRVADVRPLAPHVRH